MRLLQKCMIVTINKQIHKFVPPNLD